MGVPAARTRLAFAGLGAALLATLGLGLDVRVPEDADLALRLAVNGPRLLLALAVGVGLGVSGGVFHGPAPRPRREALVFALACGAAVGGTRAVGFELAGPISGFALGAVIGALGFAALALALERLPAVSHLALGLALFGMGALALGAAVSAKGDPEGLRPVTWWCLGDFSRAQGWSAALALAATGGLALWLARRAPVGRPLREVGAGRRRELAGLAALTWGVAIGLGGVVAWLPWLGASAARRLLGTPTAREGLAAAALCGALGAAWADGIPRLLVGGYAFPAGLAVAMLAVPGFLALGRSGQAAGSRRRAVAVRATDWAAAVATAGVVAAFVGFLTYLVSILG